VSDPGVHPEAQLIDLHAHTNASDGSLTPGELVDLAKRTGLAALAITDHDTFDGFEAAVPLAREVALDLIRGIELNSKLDVDGGRERRSAHLLGYWASGQPSPQFTAWLLRERLERRERNRRLAEALQARDIEITLEEVERTGRSLAGRVHFARLLVEKGYAGNIEDAFQRYLGENAPTYVERESQTTEEAIHMVRSGGGVPVLAHPVRLSLDREAETAAIRHLKDAGLLGLEIYHSEHPPDLQAHYRQLAEELGLLPTGGSDFHGSVKPDIQLGTGRDANIRVPREFLERMRRFVQ
jgi:hypothetical protein